MGDKRRQLFCDGDASGGGGSAHFDELMSAEGGGKRCGERNKERVDSSRQFWNCGTSQPPDLMTVNRLILSCFLIRSLSICLPRSLWSRCRDLCAASQQHPLGSFRSPSSGGRSIPPHYPHYLITALMDLQCRFFRFYHWPMPVVVIKFEGRLLRIQMPQIRPFFSTSQHLRDRSPIRVKASVFLLPLPSLYQFPFVFLSNCHCIWRSGIELPLAGLRIFLPRKG